MAAPKYCMKYKKHKIASAAVNLLHRMLSLQVRKGYSMGAVWVEIAWDRALSKQRLCYVQVNVGKREKLCLLGE